jgi:FkbM family methyltransferase
LLILDRRVSTSPRWPPTIIAKVNKQVVSCNLLVGSIGIDYELVIDVDLGDPIGTQVIAGQWNLSPALRWLLASLKPGDTVLDLGAHIGTFAIPAAKLGARVVAVEGSPRNAAVLRAACEQNHLENVEIVEMVVDSKIGEVEFVDLGPYGTISTPDICSETGYPTIRRLTTTVDDLPGGPFVWVKVDIEGKEQAVLTGGRGMMKRIRGMVIESNGYALHSHGTSPSEMVQSIENLGLTVYEVTDGELRPVRRPLVQPETIVDYVAVREALNLPAGWAARRTRDDTEIVTALMYESKHPIQEHRDHADRTVEELTRKLARRYRRVTKHSGARLASRPN